MNKFALVISSCDLYSDCWKPLFHSIHKYWPDCPYPIYLICNYMDSGDDSVIPIKVGEHLGWGSNTKKALSQIECDYLIYFQEDYFMNKPVNTECMKENLEYCVKNNVDYLRLMPPFKDKYPYDDIYCIDKAVRRKTKLRAMSLMACIWKKSTLDNLCIEGWTGWDFERKILAYIKERNIKINRLVVKSSMYSKFGLPVIGSTGIRKGIWTKEGYDYLVENGFILEAQGRKVEGKFMTWCRNQHQPLLRIPCAIMIRIMQKIMN